MLHKVGTRWCPCSYDSSSRPVNRKSVALPIAQPRFINMRVIIALMPPISRPATTDITSADTTRILTGDISRHGLGAGLNASKMSVSPHL